MKRTRVAILGAGSIGCHLGGWLAAAADVTLIGRPGIVDAIEQQGLTVSDLRGRTRTVPPDSLTLATEASSARGTSRLPTRSGRRSSSARKRSAASSGGQRLSSARGFMRRTRAPAPRSPA